MGKAETFTLVVVAALFGAIVVGRLGFERAFHALGAVVFVASILLLLYFALHAFE